MLWSCDKAQWFCLTCVVHHCHYSNTWDSQLSSNSLEWFFEPFLESRIFWLLCQEGQDCHWSWKVIWWHLCDCAHHTLLPLFNHVTLIFNCFLSEVIQVDLLDQLLKFLALSIGITGTVFAGSFKNVIPVLLAPSFKCSSSNLTKDFPSSFFKKILSISKLE